LALRLARPCRNRIVNEVVYNMLATRAHVSPQDSNPQSLTPNPYFTPIASAMDRVIIASVIFGTQQ
jgi:hypothetical protein